MEFKDFIGKGDLRECLREPFNLNGLTAASNGHSAIWTNKFGDYKDCPSPFLESLSKIIADGKDLVYRPLPDISIPEKTVCKVCSGRKKAVTRYCKECDGEGEVDAETDYNTYYDLECKSCGGKGTITDFDTMENCSYCSGTGEAFDENAFVRVFSMKLNLKFYDILKKDKNVEVSRYESLYLYFKSGDKEGVFMGMRED